MGSATDAKIARILKRHLRLQGWNHMVRVGFQRHPWDLVAILGYTLSFGTVVAASGSGNWVAYPIIAFTPGYCATAAIFPGKSDISWSERLGLSIALSMAFLALLGVALDLSFG